MKYTKDSLQNTWGIVESKEHAEFIIELAENAGLDVGAYSEKSDSYFYTDDDYIGFTDSEILASNRDEKQIAIPLPPKELLKNAGDNLILGCEDSIKNLCDKFTESILKKKPLSTGCDSKCDEWPQVGDEVCYKTTGNCEGVVLAIDSDVVWVKDDFGGYSIINMKNLAKPKTPEEELSELLHLLWDENGGDFDGFVDIAIGHVTKKPQ